MIELMVVAGIIVTLALLAIPALSGLTASSSQNATRGVMRSLFASARARAATRQQFVGIRFQQNAEGRTYAVMLEPAQPPSIASYDNFNGAGCPIDPGWSGESWPDDPNCAYLTFVAAEGTEPLALPAGVELAYGDMNRTLDAELEGPAAVNATTFTIVFAPTGQVVRRRVFIGQRAYVDPGVSSSRWHDTIFYDQSMLGLIDVPLDMGAADLNRFRPLQPDTLNPTSPLQAEVSQNSLWIYDRQRRIDAGAAPVTGYVGAQGIYVQLNAYTGAMIDTQGE